MRHSNMSSALTSAIVALCYVTNRRLFDRLQAFCGLDRQPWSRKANHMTKILTVAGLLCWLGISSAHADLVTIDWSGEIRSSPAAIPFSTGDNISGAFLFDSQSPVIGSNGTEAVYATDHSTVFSVNGLSVFGSGGTIGNDLYDACVPPVICVGLHDLNIKSNSFSGDLLGGIAVDHFTFTMGWLSFTSPLPRRKLPSQIDIPPQYIEASIFLQGLQEAISLDIDDVTLNRVSSVPVPATGYLLAVAVAILGLRGRREERNSAERKC